MRGDVNAKLNGVYLDSNRHLTFEQQDKTIKKQLKVIKKLQKRVKAEQQRKNQLASQLKELKQQQNTKEEINI
ncbi:hypothetical protein JZO69_02340 [Enterococcus sp. DIV0869a]|uniref:Uncharacterized protein n=1 Tax=Candidatus Enterococcus ikei TaxID=2815326 RepID=A0ABS3GVB4_9ENTE|nr:hypothetical protein [Enterococcus sp. DIV0869a]